MSGKYLLDTNIVIALFANDPAVVGKIGKRDEVFVPAVVIGELFYGAKKSGRPEKNSERIERFVSFQHDLILISRDEHFKEVEGLKLERW